MILMLDLASDLVTKTPANFNLKEVEVRLTRTDEYQRWDWTMNTHHHLGFKRFARRGQRDLIT